MAVQILFGSILEPKIAGEKLNYGQSVCLGMDLGHYGDADFDCR